MIKMAGYWAAKMVEMRADSKAETRMILNKMPNVNGGSEFKYYW